MKPEYHPPDDTTAADQPSAIEQRLKQLQPRPAAFDAQTVLTQARETEPPVALPPRVRNGRSARWMAISTAFVAGTAAGVLLTCLVLLRGGAGKETATGDGRQEPPVSNAAAGKGDIARDKRETVAPPVDSQWSRGEYLVSAQLREMSGTPASGTPLMAGDYVLHWTSLDSRAGNDTAGDPAAPTDSPGFNGSPSGNANPTRSLDREQLLRELLGVRPGTRL